MKKFGYIFLMIIMFGLMSFQEDNNRIKTLGATSVDVACVFALGGIGDKGFNDMAYAGLQKAQSDGLCTFVYEQPTSITEAEGYLNSYAASGTYDLIIGVGFSYQQAINNTAKIYSNQAMLSIDSEVIQGNVSSVLFETNEGSFLTGALAGLMTKTGRIGFIGGLDIPLIREFWAGFTAGAYYEKNNSYFEVFENYVGSFDDPTTAKTMAEAMWNEGVDIIFTAAGGSGIGVLESANETRGVYAIGVDANQDDLYPGRILTSMMKRMDLVVYNAIEDVYNANWIADVKTLGLAEDGVVLTPMRYTKDLIGPEIIEKVNVTLRNKIINNDISVPSNFSSLSQWLTDLKILNKSYTPYSGVISITDDSHFTPLFDGSGTYNDPYLIEGLYINETSGVLISISNTRADFRIGNNLINGYTTSGRGILLVNVTHAMISNNAIINCGGLALHDSENNSISENRIINCEYGIFFDSSNNSLILGNSIYDNKYNGIKFISSSINNTLTRNIVFRNGLYSPNAESGISIREDSNNNTISHNTVYSNGHYGIYVGLFGGASITSIIHNEVFNNMWGIGVGTILLGSSTSKISIAHNNVYKNAWKGIIINSLEDSFILNNTVHGNLDGGIMMSCNTCTIKFNIMYANAGTQINCHGNNNLITMNDFAGTYQNLGADYGANNTFVNNYWSNWHGTGSYELVPAAVGNKDSSPLPNPFHLTVPQISHPDIDAVTLKGTVSIQWTPSIDKLDHLVTYTVSFSIDEGSTWFDLASELTGTNYNWDLSTIYNGSVVLLKISAYDDVGFSITILSSTTFIVENPNLTHTQPDSTSTTTPTSTTPTTTSGSETGTTSSLTPSWSILVLFLALFVTFSLRHQRKKE